MFGVEIPRNVRHALEIDKMNGNNLWREAMDKELKVINEFKTLKRLEKGEELPGTYQTCTLLHGIRKQV
jgi:hypothetical protein